MPGGERVPGACPIGRGREVHSAARGEGVLPARVPDAPPRGHVVRDVRYRTGLLLLLSCAAAPVAAVPTGPPPLVAPSGAACSPSPAWIATERGDQWLSSPTTTCTTLDPATGLIGTTIGDGPLVSRATPRLVLRRGEDVTVHFASAPGSVVLLRVRPGPRATTGRSFRLSPFVTRWRARPGSGVLEFRTTQRTLMPAGAVPGERIDDVLLVAVYRTPG